MFEFALLFLLELALEGVDGGGRSAVGDGCGLTCRGRVGVLRWGGCWRAADGELLLGLLSLRDGCGVGLGVGQLLGGLDGGAVGADDLHAEEVAAGVFLETHHHAFKHLEGLFLVGDERVLLRVAAQADAFLEMVHGEEVILP